jgi:AcrR family transcriptional regulator
MQLSNEWYRVHVIEPVGLRARKKLRTRDAIADAAISLFLARGFDQVSVSDIAAAAEVSKPTLFRYFPTKEDLVLHRFADHNGEAARVVSGRGPDLSPITALHRHFRAGLDNFEPVTGLNDHPEVVAFHRLVFATASLAGRLTQYLLDDEDALAAALDSGIAGRLQAAQVIAVQRVLARTNWQKIADGRTARDVQPEAIADADQAFAQLSRAAGTSARHREALTAQAFRSPPASTPTPQR